ncbi:HIT domain-containing protein [Candidatus Woesebacteria bacterium]|jgi:histidine triad (HIT) family protein|nr:HIT domain-containing protein [Candidatus Woesebacteria bacterium]HNV45014.1 HIT domain-containing protein [Candidatus Woesebacteria bacterium]HOA11727.1 HIT domain-containing protein [Candidatus Woesebacteria bacterium]HOC07353.1 HIT domain-containing protein [Candidatus Woesebacteria bacterium]HOI05344.1 HIT domain-containing protein [Candidatus Woesebacteria bacterium]
MTESVFTKIIKRELPSTIHYEDDQFIVISSNDPKAPVHLLIITKRAYQNLEEVDPENQELHAKMLLLCRKMAQEKGISDNYQIHINVGKAMQQVQHLHIHLLGGWKNPEKVKQRF